MRTYSKVSPKFWIGRTGKEIRKFGPEVQLVALYLVTGPHANWLGLYHLPTLYIAADTGMEPASVSAGLDALCAAGFCAYDPASEMVWVYEMARYQCLESGRDGLKPADNQVKAIRKEYAALPDTPLLKAFHDKYKDMLCLDAPRGGPLLTPSEAPCQALAEPLADPLPSKEIEKEKEKEKDSLSSQVPGEHEGEGEGERAGEDVPFPAEPPGEDPDAAEKRIRQRHAGIPDEEMSLEFLELAEAYPRKDPPLLAWPAWKGLKQRRRLPVGGVNAVIDAAHVWRDTDEWQRDNGRFIPSLKKFLEGEFWTIQPRASPAELPKLAKASAFAKRHGGNDRQKQEEALREFCRSHNLDFAAYAARIFG